MSARIGDKSRCCLIISRPEITLTGIAAIAAIEEIGIYDFQFGK
jgi:hypothetical protein